MMQYMILTASVLVLVWSTGVNADGPKKRLKAAKLVDMAIPANGSKNKGPKTRLTAAKLEDMIIPANYSNNEDEPGEAPVRAQASGCDSYELSGSTYKGAIHGRYSKTSYTCSSKPVYSSYSSSYGKTIYLYYRSSTGSWGFSDIQCDSSYYVVSTSLQNSYPDDVVSWKEADTPTSWYTNSGIEVKCGSTPSTQGCDSYRLSGCIYQSEIHGWYSKTSDTCSSKPVYKGYSSDIGKTVYLYYHSSSGLWAFYHTRCSSIVYVASVSLQNNYPDDVVSWKEVDSSSDWYENSGIGVECSSDTAKVNPLVVLILLVCGCVATWK